MFPLSSIMLFRWLQWEIFCQEAGGRQLTSPLLNVLYDPALGREEGGREEGGDKKVWEVWDHNQYDRIFTTYKLFLYSDSVHLKRCLLTAIAHSLLFSSEIFNIIMIFGELLTVSRVSVTTTRSVRWPPVMSPAWVLLSCNKLEMISSVLCRPHIGQHTEVGTPFGHFQHNTYNSEHSIQN